MSAATIPQFCAVGLLGLAVTVASATGPQPDQAPLFRSGASEIDCTTDSGNKSLVWHIDLDEASPIATVNDWDAPADFSPAHVRLRLAADGPTLLIGRVSGRIVVAAPDGVLLGSGQCARRVFI